MEGLPPLARVAFDGLVRPRLASNPEIDHERIFDANLIYANRRSVRLYFDDEFLVSFVVRGDRVLVLEVTTTQQL